MGKNGFVRKRTNFKLDIAEKTFAGRRGRYTEEEKRDAVTYRDQCREEARQSLSLGFANFRHVWTEHGSEQFTAALFMGPYKHHTLSDIRASTRGYYGILFSDDPNHRHFVAFANKEADHVMRRKLIFADSFNKFEFGIANL